MAIRSRLSVLIGGDDRQLKMALRRSRKSLNRFSKELRSGATGAAKYTAAMLAVGVAISTAMVKQQLVAVDALKKTSDKLGITTEALVGLRRAAELSGVAANTFDMALQRMVRRLSEASAGTGEAKAALKELGLDARKLAAAAPEDAFRQIAAAMDNVSTQSDKVRLAFKLFDSEGVALVNTLDLGVNGLNAAAEETRLLGTALSSIDAKKIEIANDRISAISTATEGFFRQITIQLAPILTDVSNQLIQIAKDAGGIGVVATRAFNNIVDAAGFVIDAADGIKRVFLVVANAINVAFAGVAAGITKVWEKSLLVANTVTFGMSKNLVKLQETMKRVSQQSVDVIGFAADEIQKTLMKPLPSEGLKKWVAKAEAAGDAAAAAAVKAKEARNVEAGDIGGGDTEKEQAAFDKRLEAIKGRNVTEQELLRAHQLVLDDIMRGQRENQFSSDEEFQAVVEEVNRQHMTRLVQIRKRGLTDLELFNRASWQSQAKTLTGMLVKMTGTVANQSKQMFDINKVAAIANALLTAKKTILDAYAFGNSALGPVGGAAMATIAAAATAAQVSAIRSSTYGAGGGAAPSLAGGTAAPPVTAVQSAIPGGGGDAGAGQTTIINLEGDVFGRDQVRTLIEKINEETKDGGRILIA